MFSFLKNIVTIIEYFLLIIFNGCSFILRKIPFIGIIFLPCEIFTIFHRKKSQGERLCLTLAKLGPSFIKLGQVLATRPDLIGPEISLSLQKLQDKLPAFSSKKAQKIIRSNLGKTSAFSEIEEDAIAAASIAQIHRAKLKNGQNVAIKILRPNIKKRFARDLKLFYFLAKIIDKFSKFKRLKLPEVVKYLEEITHKELDLRLEAAAASKLKENMKTDSNIYIPNVYWHLTTENILTIEWVDGIKINDINNLQKSGHNLEKLSHNLVICYFNQAYRDGYFHADMHPGNILITETGKIAFIDFGIMGNLHESDRIYVTKIIKGFINRDYNYIAKMHYAAGYVPKTTNIDDFSLACRAIGEPIFGKSVNELSIAKMLAQLFQVTERFGMQTQPQLLLLQKTLLTLEGIGEKLNPKLNIWQLGEPWMKNWAEENFNFKANLQRVRTKISETAEQLPQILHKIDLITENLSKKPHTKITNWQIITIIAILIIFLHKL